MKNKIIITLLIFINESRYHEIKNWIYFKKCFQNNSKIEFIFSSLNKNTDQNVLNLFKKNDCNYRIFSEDDGKLYTLKKSLEDNFIKGSFLKICNSYDLVDIINLENIIKELEKLDERKKYLISHKEATIKNRFYDIETFNENKKMISLKNRPKYKINTNKIFSISLLKDINLNFKNIMHSYNDLLVFFSLINPNKIYKKINIWFYIYNERNNISPYFRFTYNKKNAIEEHKKIFIEIKQVLKILKSVEIKKREFKFSLKYNLYDINNILINGKYNILDIISNITKIYYIYKKNNYSRIKLSFWSLLKCYLFQLLKKKIKIKYE